MVRFCFFLTVRRTSLATISEFIGPKGQGHQRFPDSGGIPINGQGFVSRIIIKETDFLLSIIVAQVRRALKIFFI